MQNDRQEKLHKLVNESLILNSQEKAEWLLLLDVMNDKQMGELEKILASGKKPLSAQAPVNVRTADDKMGPLVSKPPATAQMPALRHIMNLPAAPSYNNSTVPIASPSVAAPIKTPSSFASKLKTMFAEKELPASPRQASLGGPSGKTEQSLPAPTRIVPALKEPTRSVSAPSAKASPPTPPVAPPPPIKQPISPKPEPIGVLKTQPPSKTAAGINFPKISPTDQLDTLKAIKEHIGQGGKPADPAAASLAGNESRQAKIRPIEKINLQDLGDLTLLTPQILAKSDLNVLVGKIRELISSHSYHEALFNIEKSDLYKIYLSTGLKLLTDQINFEELATRPRAEAYLEREEFEKVADLLKQIQIA